MTTDQIKERIKYIEAIKSDDEVAHGAEDDLYRDFIAYVASGGEDLVEKAKLVLSTQDIKFARWCA